MIPKKRIFKPILLCAVTGYWHYILLLGVFTAFVYLSQKPQKIVTSVTADQPVQSEIAFSKPDFNHFPYSRLSDVRFDSLTVCNAFTVFGRDAYSCWYKMRFEKIPHSLTLDFFQYETVLAFDVGRRPLNMETAESGITPASHRRHNYIALAPSVLPALYYFKVFAKKCLPTDSLQIRFCESREFNNEKYREFYDNQEFSFFVLLLFGMGVFQLFYIGSLAWSRRKPEYAYYGLFILTGMVYLIISRRFELGYIGHFKYLYTSSIVVYLAIASFFYCRFVRYYLDSANQHPFLDRQYRKAERFLAAGAIVNFLIYAATNDLEYTFAFFVPFVYGVVGLNLYLLWLNYRFKSALVQYLLNGVGFAAVIFFFKTACNYLYSLGLVGEPKDLDTYGSSLAIIIDSVFLNLGLNYKHRLENLDKQTALGNLRHDVAADLHDDVGASLIGVSVLMEQVKALMGTKVPEAAALVERVSDHLRKSIENLKVIVWATDVRYNKLSDLIEMMQDFSAAFNDVQPFEWKIDVNPPALKDLELTPAFKKNVYFIFKEAVNNAVKHAHSKKIYVEICVENGRFQMRVQDFGVGFQKKKAYKSLGLESIENRAKIMGGRSNIESIVGNGAVVDLAVPLNK